MTEDNKRGEKKVNALENKLFWRTLSLLGETMVRHIQKKNADGPICELCLDTNPEKIESNGKFFAYLCKKCQRELWDKKPSKTVPNKPKKQCR